MHSIDWRSVLTWNLASFKPDTFVSIRVVKSATISAQKRCSSSLDSHLLCKGFMVFVFIYYYWCPTQFPNQMMFVSFNSYMTGIMCGTTTATLPEHPVFTGFVLLFFYFLCCGLWTIVYLFVIFPWPLYCLSFYLRLLITNSVSSTFFFNNLDLVAQTWIKFKSQLNLKCKLILCTFQVISSVN